VWRYRNRSDGIEVLASLASRLASREERGNGRNEPRTTHYGGMSNVALRMRRVRHPVRSLSSDNASQHIISVRAIGATKPGMQIHAATACLATLIGQQPGGRQGVYGPLNSIF
jgi:hypothetical protein